MGAEHGKLSSSIPELHPKKFQGATGVMGEEEFLNEIINLPLHAVGHALDKRSEKSWNRSLIKQVHHVSWRGQRNTKGIVTKVYSEKCIVTKVS
jgi:hypothetical protein